MIEREAAILEWIQHQAKSQAFTKDMLLAGEAVAIRSYQAGDSAHRSVERGIQAAQKLAKTYQHDS